MNRVYAHMCVRNEADRYLADVLAWTFKMVDGIHVYDDRSTDDTAVVADHAGARVSIRQPDATPFAENESKFRQEAWFQLERAFEPDTGDWVLAVDADEFAVPATGPHNPDVVRDLVARTRPDGPAGYVVRIPEVFAVDPGGRPFVRVDGWWPTIAGLRLVRWTTNHTFTDRALGGGSVPAEIVTFEPAPELVLLHYGYADPAERQARHDRYINRPGHSTRHVRSILAPGRLEPWDGPAPDIRIG